MNNRGLKRRHTLHRMAQQQRTTSARLILTPEDKGWLNMPPVGREFGSQEFEKLESSAKPE